MVSGKAVNFVQSSFAGYLGSSPNLGAFPVESSLVVAPILIKLAKVVRFHTTGLMKVCTKCKIDKEDSEFCKKRNRLDSVCRACHSIISKLHYQNNKARYKKLVRTRNKDIVEWFKEFKKDLKCSECPENHPWCLDFHHLDKSTKESTIANLVVSGYSKEKILAEISKCIVLCSNCHRKLHYEEYMTRLLDCSEDASNIF